MGFEEDTRVTGLACESTASGLVLNSCPNIKRLLSTGAVSQVLSPELRDAALQHLESPVVPYPILRDVWVQLTPGYGVPFCRVLEGSSFVLESPKPREKSKELKERLAKLQDLADKKAYGEVVKDVANHDQGGEQEYMSSYKDSLGFGMHVIFIMFTGFMFGFAIVRSQLPGSPGLHVAGGVVGLIAGMLVETLLFITRATMAEKGYELKEREKRRSKYVPAESAVELPVPLSTQQSDAVHSTSEIVAGPEDQFRLRQRRPLVLPSDWPPALKCCHRSHLI